LKVTVFIERMKTHIKCGVYEEERSLGGQFEVSVYVESGNFIDYQKLYELIEILSQKTYVYMEDFGKELLNKINLHWNPNSVIIRIVKLSVPFRHSFERAGIEIRWERDGERD